jgi:hypothetical protein
VIVSVSPTRLVTVTISALLTAPLAIREIRQRNGKVDGKPVALTIVVLVAPDASAALSCDWTPLA